MNIIKNFPMHCLLGFLQGGVEGPSDSAMMSRTRVTTTLSAMHSMHAPALRHMQTI